MNGRNGSRPPEPFGHRGHPTEQEQKLAHRVASQLLLALGRLMLRGVPLDEAVSVIAETAWEQADDEGETWAEPKGARRTIEGLYLGRAAKEWSIRAVNDALRTLGPPPRRRR